MLDLISELETRLIDPSAKGLAQAVTRAIREGVLSPGDRLPPIRELGHQLALSPTTVSAAWSLLIRAGAIQTAGRRGTVVTDLRTPRKARYRHVSDHEPPFSFDLSTGAPDPDLLPDVTAAVRRAASAQPRKGYSDVPVVPELAEVLSASWPCPARTLIIADGAMDALELVIRSTIRFGDRVVVENPTLRALVDLLESAGADIIGVPVDQEGIDPVALEAACIEPVQAVFLQPRAHNPTGVSMSAGRARALVKVLRRVDALIVEDDSVGAIASAPEITVARALPNRTVHIRSYSKSHGPDLRLAAMSGPDDVLAGVRHIRQLGQGWSSWLLQRVLLELLTDPKAIEQVEAARVEYARRQATFADVLGGRGVRLLGHDGLNAWVPVEDESAALMRLAAASIGAAPGGLFTVKRDKQAHIRVTVGLVSRDLEEVSEQVAQATDVASWGTRAR